jgi:hypothetical protein
MKIFDWLKGKDEDEDEKPEDDDWPEEEALPGDEDDPTVYPLW